ncbi:hypothetical protein DPMN_063618 [Dreissena polymorpha]|uniref:B box-type domain-containing protein n=1 Tax=Dreissena polymorpha TaxID=45954 RepID=A0A9D4CBP5_DREPO|nr:hypothetical protein DPMN_063618 [Dreissena polymorpha]
MATFSESTVGKDKDLADLRYCSDCQKLKIKQRAKCYCETCVKFYCAKCVNKHSRKRGFKKHVTYGTEDKKMWPFPDRDRLAEFLQKCGLHENKDLEMFCNERQYVEVSVHGDPADHVTSGTALYKYSMSGTLLNKFI